MFAIKDEISRRCRNNEQLSAHSNKLIHLYFRRLPSRGSKIGKRVRYSLRGQSEFEVRANVGLNNGLVNIMEMELVVVTVLHEDGSDMSLGTSGDDDLESRDLWELMCKKRQNGCCILL